MENMIEIEDRFRAQQEEAEQKYNCMQARYESMRHDLVTEIGQLREVVDRITDEKVQSQVESDKKYNDMQMRYEEGMQALRDHVMDLENQRDYQSFLGSTWSKLHDEIVVESWEHRDQFKKWFCTAPFERMEIMPEGEVYTCCVSHIKRKHILGNAYEATFSEIWNSDNAKKTRYAVNNGNFEYCNRQCPWLKIENSNEYNSYLQPRLETPYKFERWQDASISTTPKEIVLSCDCTCNLTCPSCRPEIRALPLDHQSRLVEMLEKFVRPALKDCTHLMALGSGEFFASKPIMNFCKTIVKEQYPNLRMTIQTNGQLFTPERWEQLSNLKGIVSRVNVSIDSADKETYEKMRRGGKWERLVTNMEYLASLKDKGDIGCIQTNFVVQKDNYNQMREFVQLAKNWNIDRIIFSRLLNLGAYTESEFQDLNVTDENNPVFNEVMSIFEELKDGETHVEIIDNINEAS